MADQPAPHLTPEDQPPSGLTAADLAEQAGTALPPREQMSLITPGAVDGTPAMEALPDEAMTWHGNPDDPHIM